MRHDLGRVGTDLLGIVPEGDEAAVALEHVGRWRAVSGVIDADALGAGGVGAVGQSVEHPRMLVAHMVEDAVEREVHSACRARRRERVEVRLGPEPRIDR